MTKKRKVAPPPLPPKMAEPEAVKAPKPTSFEDFEAWFMASETRKAGMSKPAAWIAYLAGISGHRNRVLYRLQESWRAETNPKLRKYLFRFSKFVRTL